MSTVLSDWYPLLADVGGHLRAVLNGFSLGSPGTLPGLATLVLCATAAIVILDASRRTLAVPRWSYLRRDAAELAAERDGKRRLVDNLRAECEALSNRLDVLRAEKAKLGEVVAQREQQEAALRLLSERLARLETDRAQIEAIRADLAELGPLHGTLKGEIAALEEQRAERKADLERLLGRQAELEQTLSEAKASRDGIGLEAASVKAEFNSLLRQVEAARASLRDAEDDTRRQAELAATLERELGARKGELAALQARIEQLQKTQYELDSHVAAAQGTRTKLVESNGRLEADRSALWVEFIGLQEKRNAAIAEASAAESRLWDLRQQRNALNNEVEMLKRLVGNMQQNASGGSARA